MDIIDCVLTEEMVKKLDISLLERLASCSRDIIVERVSNYLEDESIGCDEVKQKLRTAYAGKIRLSNALDDTVLDANSVVLENLNYESVHAATPTEKLLEYKELIDGFLNSPDYVPYIAPIPGDIINDLILDLKGLHLATKEKCFKDLYLNLNRAKSLFRDPPGTGYRGTRFKNLNYKKTMLETISKGIDFLLEMRKIDAKPEAWRIF